MSNEIKEIFSVGFDHKVGFVFGPGENAKNCVGLVKRKVEDRWGRFLEIEMPDGELKRVHRFISVGIGAYYLGA